MTTALALDAGSSNQSATSTSPTPETQQSDVSAPSVGNASSSLQHISIRQEGGLQPPRLVLKEIDPKSVRIGCMPNRTPEAYKGDEFEALRESISTSDGNMVPIHVRETEDHYELISGERRLHAARLNDQPILAIVYGGTTEQGASHLRIVENANRKDLSPYERGIQLSYVLDQKHVFSVSQLARLVGMDKSVVSRALELAKLPPEIVQAFSSVGDIRYADAKPLRAAFEKSKDNVLVEVELIKAQGDKLKGPEVVKRLVDAANGGVAPCNTPEPIAIKFEDEVVGELSRTTNGGTQIVISLPLRDKQCIALAAHIGLFISRSVLRSSSPQRAKARQKKQIEQSMAVNTASASSSAVVDAVSNDE